MSDFIYTNDTAVKLVDCENAFNYLTEKEKLYVHYLSRACFHGALIVLAQTSLESPLIFVLLHKLFKAQPLDEIKQIALNKCNFSDDEFRALLVYTAGFFAAMGNYKGFGDTKFIPDLPKEKFKDLVNSSAAAAQEPEKIQNILSCCIDLMYSLEDIEKRLGAPYIGKTTYLSKNITEEDLNIVKNFIQNQNMCLTNTRLFKTTDDSGAVCYEIRLASVLQNDDNEEKNLLTTHTVDGHKFLITRGDYSELLKLTNKYLLIAKNYAANENQVKMLENYIQSFHTGSVDGHKEGSRYWIKDKGPTIESYIGFIEVYRDPVGMRGEFEGFVALVNQEMTVKFTNLLRRATDFLKLLPWPSEYEKNVFLRPDFTSLDIITFAGSDIPAGICIPNYEEIRQYEGFKNVSLGNIIIATKKNPKKANFLSTQDQALIQEYIIDSYEVQVGLHELLGHGSGKLFQEKADGLNINLDEVRHLETNEKISKYYKLGETYDSVFSGLGSPYEECRADCVGLYLSLDSDVLKEFGHEGSKAEKVLCCNWLSTLASGLRSLRMYDPETSSWLQAHCQASAAMLRVCLEAGEGFVNIEEITGEDGNPDLLFTMDYSKIKTVGKKAIGDFLRKLQVYKSTADFSSAKEMFEMYSAVTADGRYPFLKYRDIVMARKKPRDMFVQVNTIVESDKVQMINYEPTHEGLIQSIVDRFKDHDVDSILELIYEKEKLFF